MYKATIDQGNKHIAIIVKDDGGFAIDGHTVPTPQPEPTTIVGTFSTADTHFAYGWVEGEPAPYILATGGDGGKA